MEEGEESIDCQGMVATNVSSGGCGRWWMQVAVDVGAREEREHMREIRYQGFLFLGL